MREEWPAGAGEGRDDPHRARNNFFEETTTTTTRGRRVKSGSHIHASHTRSSPAPRGRGREEDESGGPQSSKRVGYVGEQRSDSQCQHNPVGVVERSGKGRGRVVAQQLNAAAAAVGMREGMKEPGEDDEGPIKKAGKLGRRDRERSSDTKPAHRPNTRSIRTPRPALQGSSMELDARLTLLLNCTSSPGRTGFKAWPNAGTRSSARPC